MQTFTKKFITFEPNEIFEFFKKHCKVQEAHFYEKNHKLDENKKILKFEMSISAFLKEEKCRRLIKNS